MLSRISSCRGKGKKQSAGDADEPRALHGRALAQVREAPRVRGCQRPYLLARLLWNPDLDWRQERRDFCAAYYGAAAGPVVEQYLDDVRHAFVEQGVHTFLAVNPEDFHWITPTMFARWYAILDRAEALTENETHQQSGRIKRPMVEPFHVFNVSWHH